MAYMERLGYDLLKQATEHHPASVRGAPDLGLIEWGMTWDEVSSRGLQGTIAKTCQFCRNGLKSLGRLRLHPIRLCQQRALLKNNKPSTTILKDWIGSYRFQVLL